MRRAGPIDRRRLLQGLLAVWVVGLLALPATMWLLGSRQPILESRAKAEFPTLNRATVVHEETFREIDTALLDRFPGRGSALDLHAQIAIDLFHDSPNPVVAVGQDGYLYYLLDLETCHRDNAPLSDPADAAEILARTLVASGRRTAVAITPSKQFIHPADAPDVDEDLERCAGAMEQRVEQRLARTPGGLTIAAEQRAAEARGAATFLRKDTHWNWRGREIYVRRMLERIRAGLADETGLHVGSEQDRPGDLLAMMGRPGTERDRSVSVRRAPRRPFSAGELLVIGDSQSHFALRVPGDPATGSVLDVVFPGAIFCDWTAIEAGGCDEVFRRARAVVMQKVARDVRIVTQTCWRMVAVAAEQLPGSPAEWERIDGGALRGTRLELPASGVAGVRVRAPGADVATAPRLARIPIEHAAGAPPAPVTLTQRPQAGPIAPCASPTPLGDALYLPIPAGRRASDLVVQLQGPPETVIGRPQIISLDDAHARGPRGRER